MQTLTTTEASSNEKKELRELLKTWNLEHLADFLIAEKIRVTTLKMMEPHHLPRLFKDQKQGDLIEFEYHLKMWKHSLEKDNVFFHLPEITTPRTESPFTSISSSSATSTESSNCTLADILNNSRKSSIITNYYSSHSKLLMEHRNLLMNIICDHFDENNMHMSLTTSYKLEKEIIQRFPGEKLEYYRNGKRGRIYSKFCNAKTQMRALQKRSANSDEFADESASSSRPGKNFAPEENAESYVRALKFDKLSASDFDTYWKACSRYRLGQMSNICLTETFLKWPEYKKPNGFRLIDMDFGVLFGDPPGLLSDWDHYGKRLLSFLLDAEHVKDRTSKKMLQGLGGEDTLNDLAAVKLMWCLHAYLLPTQRVIKKDNAGKKSVVKFTIKSSQEAFLYIGNNVQQIDDYLNFLKAKQDSIQPFIVAVGDKNLDSLSTFYVYIDGVKFLFDNFLRAVDICLKCFHLFNLEYPAACSNVWEFLSNCFYKIPCQKSSTKIIMLTEAMQASE